jgi:hypothetical protein
MRLLPTLTSATWRSSNGRLSSHTGPGGEQWRTGETVSLLPILLRLLRAYGDASAAHLWQSGMYNSRAVQFHSKST